MCIWYYTCLKYLYKREIKIKRTILLHDISIKYKYVPLLLRIGELDSIYFVLSLSFIFI